MDLSTAHKIQADDRAAGVNIRKNKNTGRYIPLKLTLRYVTDIDVYALESINISIENLLERYKRAF